MFVFLAASFAIGFVAFGVGSDVQGGLDQLFQGRAASSGPDVDEARERVRESPRSAQAQLELAEALQQAGEPEEAIRPLERYLELRAGDEEALQLLATLYLTKSSRLQEEAALAQQDAATLDPGRAFRPPAQSPLGQAIEAQSSFTPASDADQRVTEIYTELEATFTAMKDAYQKLAKVSPDDPTVQLQLAEAAQNSGDTRTAIRAYKRFLQLDPENPSAAVVRQQVRALEGSLGGSAAIGP